MQIGGSLAVIAIGAILRWAITVDVEGVDLSLIGTILMIVGAVALVASIIWAVRRRRTDIVHRGATANGMPVQERTTVVEPNEYNDAI